MTNKVEGKASMNTDRARHTLTLVGDRVYVLGGIRYKVTCFPEEDED